jgi:hypothetical protein
MVVLDLVDLHSRWKDWVLAGNAFYLPAFSAVGGDIASIPLYLFIGNGWKIVPQSADHSLAVTGGVLNSDNGSDPFIDPVGTYKIRINREAPGIAIGYSASGVAAPTAEQNAAAVGARIVEGAMSQDAMTRVILAALAGRSEGIGTLTEKYKSLDGMEDRITVSFDASSNRTTIVLDGS